MSETPRGSMSMQIPNKLNEILDEQNEILKKIATSQNQNHAEMMDVLKRIGNKM